MNRILNSKNYNFIFIIILVFLLSLKFIEIMTQYCFNGDGPWSLSPTLSMLKGDWGWSRLAHEPDGQVYKNYSYSILFYIPFKIFGVSHFTYTSSYFLYIILSVLGIYKIFKGYNFLQFFLSLTLVSSVYTYNFRFEILAIFLIIWGLFFYFKGNKNSYIALFLFAWAALIHPATFVVMFFVMVHLLYFEKKIFDFKTILIYLSVFIFFCFLLLGFNINNLIDPILVRPELQQRFMVLRPENIIKWLVLAGVFVWSFIILLKKTSWISVLIIASNILVYFLFKKSYYYPYLILHIIIIFYYNRDIIVGKYIRMAIFAHLAVFAALFFVFPVYKSIENPLFGDMMRKNVAFLENLPNNNNSKIYIERELVMGIANNDNARLYFKEYQNYYNGSPKIDLKQNDKIYLFRESELESFKSEMSSIVYQKNIQIKQIYAPVPGILTFRGRAGRIGFWEISLK